MRRLVHAEALKARTGKAWWLMLVIGIPWTLVVCLGVSVAGMEYIEKGATTEPALQAEIARQWFAMLLFTALFGTLLVGREFSTRSIARSTLLSESRNDLIRAKLVVGVASGAAYGLLAVALAFASMWFFFVTNDLELQWTTEVLTTLLGVFAVSVLAAAWGVLIGWICREQIVGVVAVLGLTLLVEPGLQAIAPDIFNFPFTIALSSIYQDTKDGLLAVPAAVAICFAWLAGAGALAVTLTRRMDVP